MVPVRFNRPLDQRVDLSASAFQDKNREKGIQNIQPCNQQQAEEKFRTVAVNVTPSALIFCASERTPSAE